MNSSVEENQGRNVFHALAAVGSTKQALKLLSTTPKKIVTAGLLTKDNSGRTPLHLAAYYGHIKILKAFIDAVPEARDVKDSDANNVRDALRRPDIGSKCKPEDQFRFQRLVRFDKTSVDYHDFELGPVEVWDLAMSNKSSVMVVQSSWAQHEPRAIHALINGDLKQLNLDDKFEPRFVATSNVHSLAATSFRCYAWGKSRNCVLGIDSNEKIISEPTLIDKVFGESPSKANSNKYDALNANTNILKDPLIGVACSDFFSCCYSSTMLWCWGTNRGQMLNKLPMDSETNTPEVLIESNIRIRSVCCCDSAIAILFVNGTITLLQNGRSNKVSLGKTTISIEEMVSKGNYLAMQTSQGKMLRLLVKPGLNDSPVTVWSPRKPKDKVASFVIAENGNMIIATGSGVYKLEESGEIFEYKHLKGMNLSKIQTDSQCKSVMAINDIDCGTSYSEENTLVRPRNIISQSLLEEVDCESPTNGDMKLLINSGGQTSNISVHSCVLYARCPTLRGLIDGSNSKTVATPSGSAIFKKHNSNTILVENSPLDSVQAFAKSLYYARDVIQPEFSENISTGTVLYEYNALQRLIICDLGAGLWEARTSNIACDIELSVNDGNGDNASKVKAHSLVMRSCSPVLTAQLTRWATGKIDGPAFSETTIEEVLKFAYTFELDVISARTKCEDLVQRLFELWHVADELLMVDLSRECEKALFKMVDLNLVVPFLQIISRHQKFQLTKLHSALVNIFVRHLSYLLPQLNELESETLDGIERHLREAEGTESTDLELAKSFDVLKNEMLSQIALGGSLKKKKRAPSFPVRASSSVSGSKPTLPVPFSSSDCQSLSLQFLPTHSFPPEVVDARNSGPSKQNEAAKSSESSDDETNWIKTKRKSKANSHATDGKDIRILSSSLSSSSSSSNSLPLNSPWATPLNSGKNSRLISTLISPASSSIPSVKATSQSTPLPPKLSSSPSPQPLLLPQLPKLGDVLSNRGATSRPKSSGKPAKPKFNSKELKFVRQFDSPFSMTQELEKEMEPTTPWKQVPKIIQTSPSVLKKLEREYKINIRRESGGSVWGV